VPERATQGSGRTGLQVVVEPGVGLADDVARVVDVASCETAKVLVGDEPCVGDRNFKRHFRSLRKMQLAGLV
jgi:hypothetical protein